MGQLYMQASVGRRVRVLEKLPYRGTSLIKDTPPVGLSALSRIVRRLAVARCTLGSASFLLMLSQLFRASFRGSLSLAVPWPHLGCSDALSALSRIVHKLAVAHCTLGSASVQVMLSQLSRARFRGSPSRDGVGAIALSGRLGGLGFTYRGTSPMEKTPTPLGTP